MAKECKGCKKDMEPLVTDANPKASEWYCPECHISVEMAPEEHTVEMALRQQRLARTQ